MIEPDLLVSVIKLSFSSENRTNERFCHFILRSIFFIQRFSDFTLRLDGFTPRFGYFTPR